MAPITSLLFTIGVQENALVAVILGALSVGVGSYLLSVVIGHLGRRTQDGLWSRWGGSPTAQLLRTQGSPASSAQREIWRDAIQRLSGVKFMSRRLEKAQPEKADQLILAAVGQVRRLGQDSRYPLVAQENAQYGVERNMFGSRWLGRSLSLLCLAITAGIALYSQSLSTSLAIGIGAQATLSVLWFIIPSESRTKAAGFRYGEQLLQAVVHESKVKTK